MRCNLIIRSKQTESKTYFTQLMVSAFLHPLLQKKMNRGLQCSPASSKSTKVFVLEISSQTTTTTKNTERYCFHLLPFILSEKLPWLFKSLSCGTVIYHLHSSLFALLLNKKAFSMNFDIVLSSLFHPLLYEYI